MITGVTWMRVGLLACVAMPVPAFAFELSRPVTPSMASTEIVGGEIASVTNWSATWVFKDALGSPCTATAVGPRVLLIAAHCLNGGMSGRFAHHSIQVRCERPSSWQDGYDVALCSTSGVIPIRSGKPYEALRLEKPVTSGTWLTLVGFGCTRAGGTSGVLYQGTSSVNGGDPPTTFETQGGAALCAGDSGGGAYWLDQDQNRWIVGIASKTIIADTLSTFASLTSSYLANWIRKWKTRQVDAQNNPMEVKICGLDGPSSLCSG